MTLPARASAVWVVIVLAEVTHGIARTLLLAPVVGDFRARQIAVFTGSAIILAISALSIGWIRPSSAREALGTGVMWVLLTLAFEFAFGRLVAGASWEGLVSDYNLRRGGLLGIGMTILTLAPLLTAKWRRVL